MTLVEEADGFKYLLAVRPIGERNVLHFNRNSMGSTALHHVERPTRSSVPKSDTEVGAKKCHLFVSSKSSKLAHRFFRGTGAGNKSIQFSMDIPFSSVWFNNEAELFCLPMSNPINSSRRSMHDCACYWQIKETIGNSLSISPTS